jgi:8-oxo-dGTP diphosphatase
MSAVFAKIVRAHQPTTMNTPEFGERIAGQDYRPRPGAYAVIIDEPGPLALFHKKDRYFLPGGGIERGETPEEALRREVREEIGWSVAIIRKIGEATQYVITKNNEYCAIQGTYYEARLLQQIGGPEDPGDELLWLPQPEAIALLPRESDAWAIAQTQIANSDPTIPPGLHKTF